jgi:hypothetical protein
MSSVPFTQALSDEELAVDCGLVSGLGWQLGATPVFVSGLTVRQATALQMQPEFELRAQYRQDYPLTCTVPNCLKSHRRKLLSLAAVSRRSGWAEGRTHRMPPAWSRTWTRT